MGSTEFHWVVPGCWIKNFSLTFGDAHHGICSWWLCFGHRTPMVPHYLHNYARQGSTLWGNLLSDPSLAFQSHHSWFRWLQKRLLYLDWKTGQMFSWESQCHQTCFPKVLPPFSVPWLGLPPLRYSCNIISPFVFVKNLLTVCLLIIPKINHLQPGTTPSLSILETQAMSEYI